MAFPILTAEEVAELVHNGDTVCVSGFTAAGSPKAVTEAIAHKAEKEHAEGRPFKINMYSGASTNNHADGALARANALNHRSPYQNTPDLRKTINSRDTNYFDLHLSELAQKFRYGALGGVDLFYHRSSQHTRQWRHCARQWSGKRAYLCQTRKKNSHRA